MTSTSGGTTSHAPRAATTPNHSEWVSAGEPIPVSTGNVHIEHARDLVRITLRAPGSRLHPFFVLDSEQRSGFIRAYARAESAAEAYTDSKSTKGTRP